MMDRRTPPSCGRPQTQDAAANRHRRSAAALRLLVIAVALGIPSTRPAMAQDVTSVVEAPRLDVQVQADGRLVVVASDTAVDTVIGAVAAAAGVRVSTVGPMPHHRVSVSFLNRPVNEILMALMNPAGISYVLTSGAAAGSGRLVMAALESDVAKRAADSPVDASSAAVPLAGSPAESSPSLARQSAAEARAPIAERGSETAEWPTHIEPANFGPVASPPETLSDLLRAVNGTTPVTLPAGVTPNVGPALRPDQTEPVNSVKPIMPAGQLSIATGPGDVAPGRVGPSVTSAAPSGTPSSPDPMLQAPQTIRVPGPVVVRFPPAPSP